MKPKAANIIKLKFMDCSIELKDNKKNLEGRAINLLSYMIQDRLKVIEVMQQLHEYDDEPGARKSKKKIIKPDIDFMRCYA